MNTARETLDSFEEIKTVAKTEFLNMLPLPTEKAYLKHYNLDFHPSRDECDRLKLCKTLAVGDERHILLDY